VVSRQAGGYTQIRHADYWRVGAREDRYGVTKPAAAAHIPPEVRQPNAEHWARHQMLDALMTLYYTV
jgi:hypothetical protein